MKTIIIHSYAFVHVLHHLPGMKLQSLLLSFSFHLFFFKRHYNLTPAHRDWPPYTVHLELIKLAYGVKWS